MSRWPLTSTASPGLARRPRRSRIRPPAVSASVSGTSTPHVLGQDVERAGGVDLEDAVAQRRDLGRLAVELVLDRPDQLFEHVLEPHHADDAAVLVEQHGQVDPVPLEFEQELVEPQRLGQERDLPGELPEVGPAVLHGPGAEEVLDVDHADDGGQVVLAEREPGVAGLAGEPEVLLERAREAQVDDVGARDHHPPGGLLFEVQDVLDHDPLAAREVAARDALGDDVPELFFRVGQLLGSSSGPGPRSQSVRLLALLSSQMTGQKTWAITTSGGAVTSARIRGDGWPASWGPARPAPCAGR